MTPTVANSAPEVEIRVKFIHPSENKTGSFGVLPESEGPTETFRSRYGIRTKWEYVVDPETGMRLKAFRPIERDQLAYVRKERRIRDEQVCILTQQALPKGGRMTWKFTDIRSV